MSVPSGASPHDDADPPDLDQPSRFEGALRRAAAATRRFGRERIVGDRVPASVVGLLGVLAAAPMVVWPTYSLGPPDGQPNGDGVTMQQSFWSWGRFGDTSSAPESAFDIGNTVGLVMFVLALCAGLVGVTVHALLRGSDGRVLGVAGIAFAAAYVIGPLAYRLGLARADVFGDELGLQVHPVGWLELASAVLLVVATGLVALPSVVRLVRRVVVWSRAALGRRRAAAAGPASATDGGEAATPKIGIATIRDVADDREVRAVVRREHTGTGVGFTDDPAADPDRFRPPR